MTRTHLLPLGLTLLFVAGCTPTPADPAPAGPTSTVVTQTTTVPAPSQPSTSTSPSPTPTISGDTAPKRQRPEGRELVITDVRVGHHDGYDRVVFEFEGPDAPGWNIGYTAEPVQQASGYPVDYDGDIALDVHLHGLEMTVHPPSGSMTIGEVAGAHGQVTGVQLTTIFEAVGQYVIGLEGGERPFEVSLLHNPTRLVIDIASYPQA